MKKLAFLLAVLLSASVFASCGSSGASSAQTTSQSNSDDAAESEETTEAETEISDDLGDRDFGGVSFRVLTGKHQGYPTATFSASEQNGDLLNDALYGRNSKLEERFNVKIEENTLDDIFSVNGAVKNFTYAGEAY